MIMRKPFMSFDIDELVLREAIDLYGERAQLDVRQEERAEFIQAVSKHKRGKGDGLHTAEEIADLLIMINQACIILDISNRDIQSWIYKKMDRLNDRLSEVLENE